MNVEQLLQLPELASIRLIGGDITQRHIEKVTMMDAPDILPYLQPNELMITTAYHLKQNDAYFISLIEAMAQTGCTGIGIKLNRFLHVVPQAVIDAANRTSLPLIVLPEALSLGEMSYRITEHILKSETRHLTKAIDVQRHLMHLFLKGHQVPRAKAI
jgi:PucR family transcriptional regulator, purine catabolism regulatory protein